MSPDSAPQTQTLTQQALDSLVCPVCHAPLLLCTEEIVCTGCERRYPIVDGIPVLLAARTL